MSDSEVPEADAIEQARPVDEAAEPVRPGPTPSADPEAPEADALEQAQEVPADEDEVRE